MKIKKFLLFFWNIFYDFKIKIKDFFHLVTDKTFALFNPPPVVMSADETVGYLLKTGASAARFGDGEIKLIAGNDLPFQKADPLLARRLAEVLSGNEKNLLVCVPSVFSKKQTQKLSGETLAHWRRHLAYYRRVWYKYLRREKPYGNAFISRNYMSLKKKCRSSCGDYFNKIRLLWEGRDIVIIEGEKSRLGVGNDLFENAASIRRILAPSSECFSKYGEVLSAAETLGKEPLFILALGPSATVMAYDLTKRGFTALDMGNLDTEYEWFKMGAEKKTPIKNKLVYEARAGEEIGEVNDEKYNSQIILKIL